MPGGNAATQTVAEAHGVKIGKHLGRHHSAAQK